MLRLLAHFLFVVNKFVKKFQTQIKVSDRVQKLNSLWIYIQIQENCKNDNLQIDIN